MAEEFVDIVYDLLNGTRIRQPGDPDVENLFADGGACEVLYDQIYRANLHLCQRLGVAEDPDIETIINSLLCICKLTGKRMYRYSAEFANETWGRMPTSARKTLRFDKGIKQPPRRLPWGCYVLH